MTNSTDILSSKYLCDTKTLAILLLVKIMTFLFVGSCWLAADGEIRFSVWIRLDLWWQYSKPLSSYGVYCAIVCVVRPVRRWSRPERRRCRRRWSPSAVFRPWWWAGLAAWSPALCCWPPETKLYSAKSPEHLCSLPSPSRQSTPYSLQDETPCRHINNTEKHILSYAIVIKKKRRKKFARNVTHC